MAKFKRSCDSWCDRQGESYSYICLGCDQTHLVYVQPCDRKNIHVWKFNGDIETPTLSPSVVFEIKFAIPEKPNIKCHHFIRDGKIQYLNDCTHKYAGQIIDIPDWQETYGDK